MVHNNESYVSYILAVLVLLGAFLAYQYREAISAYFHEMKAQKTEQSVGLDTLSTGSPKVAIDPILLNAEAEDLDDINRLPLDLSQLDNK